MDSFENKSESFLVIGATLPRTGTTSLKAALEIIYKRPCYHFFWSKINRSDHARKWGILLNQACSSDDESIDENLAKDILRGFCGSTDIPVCAFYKQLMNIYPESKVILTIRDEKKWLESVRTTIIPLKNHNRYSWSTRLIHTIFLGSNVINIARNSLSYAIGRNIDVFNDESIIKGYKQYIEKVKKVVPQDRLLVFDCKDGWEPLCRFLQKPIPDQPYPHLNDRVQMQNYLNFFEKFGKIIQFCVTFTFIIIIGILFKIIKIYLE